MTKSTHWSRLVIAGAFAVVGVTAVTFSVGRLAWLSDNQRKHVGAQLPIGILPSRHKLNADQLQDAVRIAAGSAGITSHVDELASETVELAKYFSSGVDASKYEAFATSRGRNLSQRWGKEKFETYWKNAFNTTRSLSCGTKNVVVRQRYEDGVVTPVPVLGVEHNAVSTFAYPGLPSITEGKLDVYEVVIPAYDLRSAGGTFSVGKERQSHESSKFDGAIGFWFTFFDDKWIYIGVAIYGASKDAIVVLPAL